MKKMLIRLIEIYQKTPLHIHSSCRYIPTCSEYAKIALDRFGFFKGSFLAIKRLLKCNPLFKPGIDLVPEKKKRGVL